MPADRLLSFPQIQDLGVRYTRQHVWRLEVQGLFPRRIQLGRNRVSWREGEVLEWLQSRARGPLPQRPNVKPQPSPDPQDLEMLRRLAARLGLDLVPRKPEQRRAGSGP